MKRFSLAVAVVLGIAGFVNAQAPDIKPSPSTPVTVINTPVPVTVPGGIKVTGDVNIVNTPTVKSQQSGSWNVGIPGTVSVKNIDERGRNPYFVSLHCESRNSNVCQANAPPIPDGKRLVLEHVNASIQLRNPGIVQSFDVFTNTTHLGQMPAQLVWNDGVLTNFVINETTLAFVEARDTPMIQFLSTKVDVNVTARLSGYLVDLGL